MLVAASNPNASVLVSVARDAGGNVLQAGASAAGAPAAPAGFSTDGVTFAGNGGASGSTAGAAPGAAEAGGGIGTKALVIGGGVVAVGAAVALAGGGGGEDSSGGGSGGGGGGGGSSSSLTGRWVGNAANGGGAKVSFSGSGATCSGTQEMTLELVQSGTSLSGTGSSSWVTFNCNIPVPIPTDQGSSSGPLTGTVSGGSVTFRTSDQELYWTFNGTRSGSTLQGTATPSPSIAAIGAWTFTWRVSRQ
jgi:hypothetical protein